MKILAVSGSPKKDGNTAWLLRWVAEGARSLGAKVKVVRAADLKVKVPGCSSCRACQKSAAYRCVIDDGLRPVLKCMAVSDVIVMATPLYFFSASAQLKRVIDRMFSLYKWDNVSDTFTTPLKGKTLALVASAYERTGLDALEKPFALTADYTGMRFESLLVPNSGVSGDIKNNKAARARAMAFGKKIGKGRFQEKEY